MNQGAVLAVYLTVFLIFVCNVPANRSCAAALWSTLSTRLVHTINPAPASLDYQELVKSKSVEEMNKTAAPHEITASPRDLVSLKLTVLRTVVRKQGVAIDFMTYCSAPAFQHIYRLSNLIIIDIHVAAKRKTSISFYHRCFQKHRYLFLLKITETSI